MDYFFIYKIDQIDISIYTIYKFKNYINQMVNIIKVITHSLFKSK